MSQPAKKQANPPIKRGRKPCPNPTKGDVCPLCGGSYVCLQSWRKKK